MSQQEKSPVEIVNELKTMLTSYAEQEVKTPLVDLRKWVALGVGGAILVSLGTWFLGLGVLRLVQSEVSLFDDRLSFVPYLITCVMLGIAITLAGLAAKKTFDE